MTQHHHASSLAKHPFPPFPSKEGKTSPLRDFLPSPLFPNTGALSLLAYPPLSAEEGGQFIVGTLGIKVISARATGRGWNFHRRPHCRFSILLGPPAEHVLGWTERGRNKQHPPPKSGHQPTKYSPIRRDTIRTCKYIFRFPRLFLFYSCIWNKYLVYIYFLNLFLLRLFYFCIGIKVWCIYFILILLLL